MDTHSSPDTTTQDSPGLDLSSPSSESDLSRGELLPMSALAGEAPSQRLAETDIPAANAPAKIAEKLFPRCGMPSLRQTEDEKRVQIEEFWKDVFQEETLSLREAACPAASQRRARRRSPGRSRRSSRRW